MCQGTLGPARPGTLPTADVAKQPTVSGTQPPPPARAFGPDPWMNPPGRRFSNLTQTHLDATRVPSPSVSDFVTNRAPIRSA